MKVLVTGATGFIGRYLVSFLKKNKIDHVCLNRKNRNDHKSTHQADIVQTENFSNLMEQIKPTHLIHLAWCTEPGQFWNSTENLRWFTASKKLIEAFCKAGGKHVLLTGTCAEYDWRYGYCREDLTPVNPHSLYGDIKDATRKECSRICSHYKINLAWLRIFYPYGYGEKQARLIPSLFAVFQKEAEPFGVNLHYYRDFLHVKDVIAAITICSQKKVGGIYNVGSNEPTLLETLVRTIAELSDRNPSSILKLNPRINDEPTILVANNNKLKSLGWNKRITINEGLKNYLELLNS